jgi:hypothetical protein
VRQQARIIACAALFSRFGAKCRQRKLPLELSLVPNTLDDIGEYVECRKAQTVLLTPQKKGSGPCVTPVRLLGRI